MGAQPEGSDNTHVDGSGLGWTVIRDHATKVLRSKGKRDMNILLINVALRPASSLKLFPVGLGYIATAMKNAGIDFDLLDIDAHRLSDADVEQFIRRKKYDIVGMGCIVTGYAIVKRLAALIRTIHPQCRIIVGNSVATSILDTLLTRTETDIAVIGEGDITIVDLIHAVDENGNLEDVEGIAFIRDGRILRTPPRPLIKDISRIPFIDYSIFDTEIYIAGSRDIAGDPLPMPADKVRALPVNTSRGCIARCTFCYHVFKDAPYRHRSADSIIAEIKKLVQAFEINYIMFSDELTFFSKDQVITFSRKMIEANLPVFWRGTCRGNLFDGEEDLAIMQQMKESGCVSMGYSLESSDAGILKAMNKKVTVDEFSYQTGLFHRAGIPVTTSLVLGFPQETPETIRKTFDCCIENRIYPSSGYLLPQPGSKMYDYALDHGFISKENEEEYLLTMGDRQDLRLNMTGMSDDEFEANVLEGLERCNKELKIGLSRDELIKTKHYRSAEKL